jgi:hypothetical protein
MAAAHAAARGGAFAQQRRVCAAAGRRSAATPARPAARASAAGRVPALRTSLQTGALRALRASRCRSSCASLQRAAGATARLVSPGDTWTMWAVLLSVSAFGLWCVGLRCTLARGRRAVTPLLWRRVAGRSARAGAPRCPGARRSLLRLMRRRSDAAETL